MPEYLAPGVYVEEVDTGSKPIEGVSTSTTGMIGVTERGPVNVPILITSYGEFQRWFGQTLDPAAYSNTQNPATPDPHCYLPHAVEGFFTNGGKRVYVTRILAPQVATPAIRDVVAPDVTNPVRTQLLRSAPIGAATVTAFDGSALAQNDTVQIGSGVNAELRSVSAAPAQASVIALQLPLSFDHAAGLAVTPLTVADAGAAASQSSSIAANSQAQAGDTAIRLTATNNFNPPLAVGDLLRVGTVDQDDEYMIVSAAPVGNQVSFRSGLRLPHADGTVVYRQAVSAGPIVNNSDTLGVVANPNDGNLAMADAGAFNPALAAGDVLHVGAPGEADEYVTVGGPPVGNNVPLQGQVQVQHGVGAVVVREVAANTGTQVAAGEDVSPGDAVAIVGNAGFAGPGDFLRFDHTNGVRVEVRRTRLLQQITLLQSAYADYPRATRVERVPFLSGAGNIDLRADAEAGSTVIEVANRSTMSAGDLLQIGVGATQEFAEIADLPTPLPGLTNPGRVVLRAALRNRQPAALNMVARYAPPGATFSTFVAADSTTGATSLIVPGGNVLAASVMLRITPASGGPFYHMTTAAAPAAIAPYVITLDQPLLYAQPISAPLETRDPIAEVRAIDAGSWGNRLRVGMEIQDPPLLRTAIRQKINDVTLRLDTSAGVETGTELIVTNSVGVDTIVKVREIDRQNDYLITLEPATSLIGPYTRGDAVRTREYRFVVELLRQPDPQNPAQNNMAIDREVFPNLSLDPRHGRYFQSIIGCTWAMNIAGTTDDDADQRVRRALRIGDRRSEGESAYIRVRDRVPYDTAIANVRSGPTAEYETRPGSPRRLILLPLAHGDDAMNSINDPLYIGTDDPEPNRRTGHYTLTNIEDISIVAAPGRTGADIQGALINHCERMRYRFTVLDGPRPPRDSLTEVQTQRQQFDTKYAALYHPWLLIPHPYPITGGVAPEYPIPPSGHMLGVYARTDIERGVHKAPANEVVRGVVGLQRLLNKEQHDILNPYPVNINVIRDFRNNNRGIRVYGGRVITSDSDWKYVNVRRLLIFLEHSIDRGLQWVVFEPNADPLWARVRRTISNFLTTVWRNGALEGTTKEEAFFVKCDRTTMTQTDIDNGKLICIIGVAPVKPAEFVIIRIGLWTAHAEE